MAYDKAKWHYGARAQGNFPADLPDEAGATHIAMFVVWALLSGLGDTDNIEELNVEIPRLKSRNLTPGRYFLDFCDGSFSEEYLTDEGNAFTQKYFDFEKGSYLADYVETLGPDVPSPYHIADTWDNFDKLKPVLDKRFAKWKKSRR